VLGDCDDPAIFGPVISEVPTDADAVELWLPASWLVRYANFSELKRDRVAAPRVGPPPAGRPEGEHRLMLPYETGRPPRVS
jgi:hypothetical protein